MQEVLLGSDISVIAQEVLMGVNYLVVNVMIIKGKTFSIK